MTVSGEGVWQLPADVTLDSVPGLHALCAGRLSEIRCIDLSGVQRIDSAGVALLHWLQTRQVAAGHAPARIRGDAGRYDELCRAHRLDAPDRSDI